MFNGIRYHVLFCHSRLNISRHSLLKSFQVNTYSLCYCLIVQFDFHPITNLLCTCLNFFFAIWLAISTVALKEDFDNHRNAEVFFPGQVDVNDVFRIIPDVEEAVLSTSYQSESMFVFLSRCVYTI